MAAWLRHRAGEELRNECDEATVTGYVQGHVDGADGDKSQRISYVPLPTIYGKHADGMIRRAMIVEPAGKSGEISELIRRKLTGAVLTGSNGEPECCLAPREQGDWTFSQYLPNKAFRVWRSVTPVLLHGYNTSSRGVISVAKTERLLLRAFEMAGFREEQIENLAFQSGPFWQGTKHAAAMRVPAHLRGYTRVHVEVRFARGVRAGFGRIRAALWDGPVRRDIEGVIGPFRYQARRLERSLGLRHARRFPAVLRPRLPETPALRSSPAACSRENRSGT